MFAVLIGELLEPKPSAELQLSEPFERPQLQKCWCVLSLCGEPPTLWQMGGLLCPHTHSRETHAHTLSDA